ncbi:helix-turn-helix domain-containing protein [Lacrimispora sp. JR3]|uniref:helix-turn-helix domain-containing protein n=1 Tax=Lacrimispora sinapis TaxID=3111456 RepID=UPI003748A0CB
MKTNVKYENRLFLQFLFLVTVPLIIMGIVSYCIYVRGETAKSRLALDSYCKSVANEYENVFSSIREYYLDSTSNTSVKWLVNQKEVPYSRYKELRQAQNLLQGNYFLSKYISFYNFINVKEGWVLNKYGMYPVEDLKNKSELEGFLAEQKEVPVSLYWLNRTDAVGPYHGTVKESGFVDMSGELLVVKEEFSSVGTVYLLTVRLDTARLADLSEPYQKMGYDVTVLSNGKVLMETNPGLTRTYFAAAGKESIENGIYPSPSGKKYRLSVIESAGNDLTYITGMDLAKMNRGGIPFVLASIAIIAVFGVILVLLKLAAVAFSKPVQMLLSFVDDQNAQIKDLFLTNLLKGELNMEKIQDTMKKYEMESWSAYRLIAISCKFEEKEGPVSQEERDRVNKEISGNLPDSVREAFFLSPVLYEHMALFLIGENDDLELDNKTALVYKQIKDHVMEHYGYPVAFGISRTFHKLTHAGRAYEECSEALHSKNHNRNEHGSSLVLYDDYSLMDPAGNVYDRIMEDELSHAVDSCNEEEARRLLELVVGRMEMKGASGMERTYYVTRLLTAILDIPARASISLSDVFGNEQYNVLTKAANVYGQKELVTYIADEIFQPVMTALTEARQASGSQIVKEVTRMIKDNNGNLSLNECADVLSYHPNYISRVLKREKGVSFTDMINEEKLKIAKYLLLTTTDPISEISAKLNYNNVQNFIRFFKNQVGITPSAYRKQHKESDDCLGI